MTCQVDVTHRVKNGLIRYVVSHSENLSIEARLNLVDIFPLPDTGSYHRCSNVYENGSRKTVYELLDNIRVGFTQLPSHDFYIFIYLFFG